MERNELSTESTIRRNGIAAAAPWGTLAVADELNLTYVGTTQFAALVFERGIPHTAEAYWSTSAESIDAVLPHAIATARSERVASALLDLAPVFGDGSLALVTLSGGVAGVRIAAVELVAVADIETWLRECLPPAEPGADRVVPVTFWSYGSCGATWISRTMAVPAWDDVRDNYPSAVRERLARLLDPSFRPTAGGQLVLWHGRPGTGKTYALRALAWEWRSWCELHYVVDPDMLFGERADYLLEVVLDDDDGEGTWRLLVLEDTGELLAADAKERTGQGLSRLLNLVDGLVGQGLRVLVLVTTNEPLRRLHPAVSAPRPLPCEDRVRAVLGRGGGGLAGRARRRRRGRRHAREPVRARRRLRAGSRAADRLRPVTRCC